jgi:pathogenesis-related protein 1
MLSWSSVVEASAQTWANHLRDATSCAVMHEDGSPYGENVAGGTVGFSAAAAFNMWAVEKSGYVFNPAYAFDNNTGHYTQIVWRNTTEVGCAMAQCATGYLVYVCRYRPPGNVIGTQPY